MSKDTCQHANEQASTHVSKPCLHEYNKPSKLSEYPQGTYGEAGHLVKINAGWRTQMPVIDLDKCTNCLQCYMYCPDGVIYKTENKVSIDYDFCKGCGICPTVCKFDAIHMVNESEEA